jgi:uncharacterized membrane protein YsdA (DUF1294 family)
MFFLAMWVVLIVGFLIHYFVDRSSNRRTPFRAVELGLLWILVGGSVWGIIGVIGHLGPNSTEIAEGIGYRQSMFQWEVGWGDMVLVVLGIGCIWMRGQWMTAAVVALAIGYGGDGIGHIMSWLGPDKNDATNNVWGIPSDFIQPLLAIVLLIAYRKMSATRDQVTTAS